MRAVPRQELLTHVLWRYGQTTAALPYSVRRETSLPCSKFRIRECLLTAIAMTRDARVRARLCAGYVQLETFIPDAEFDIVCKQRNAPGEEAILLRDGLRPQNLGLTAARAHEGETSAVAILARIAGQMLKRQRELRKGH